MGRQEHWLFGWALGSVSFGGASLLIPLYIVQLGASAFELGILAATAAIVGAPGAIVFGRLADKVTHRRPLVVLTLATVAITLGVVPLLSNITAVIIANAVLWLVIAAIAPVLTMLVVDDTPESAWSERIGRLNKYQGYGWAGGLVVGAVWPLVGPQLVGAERIMSTLFLVLAVCAGASTLVAVRFLPRPGTDVHGTSDRKARRIARLISSTNRGIKGTTFVFSPNRLYWTTRGLHPRRLLKQYNRPLLVYLLAALFFFAGSAAFWAPLPLFLSDVGFTSSGIFGLYLTASLGSAVLYQGAGRLASRRDMYILQSGALGIRGMMFPLVASIAGTGIVLIEYGVALVGLAAIGLSWAIMAVVGTVIVTRLVRPGVRGEALGVYIALGAIAGGIGSIVGGWIATFGFLVAFALAGSLVLIGAVLVLYLRTISDTVIRTEKQLIPEF